MWALQMGGVVLRKFAVSGVRRVLGPVLLATALVAMVVASTVGVSAYHSVVHAAGCNENSGTGTYGGGDGSEGDPHLICSPDHLAHLSATSADWGKHFLQAAHVDASANSHSPIGGSSTIFTGTYDGGAFNITNLTVDNPSGAYQG